VVEANRALVAFASGGEEYVAGFIEKASEVAPGLAYFVVSEFPPPIGRWIPYMPGRTEEQNLARITDALGGAEIVHAALLCDVKKKHWPLRRIAFRLAPSRLLCFNENLDHVPLHPRAAGAVTKHLWWRFRNHASTQLSPGGWLYTQVWRLFHPGAMKRPFAYRAALAAGWQAVQKKQAAGAADLPGAGTSLPRGISVVIPSRDGQELLAKLLPQVARELKAFTGEVIVSDNGSADGTVAWLRREWPDVVVAESAPALSFSEAVNAGAGRAKYSYTCLLNNDMELREGFFEPLLRAFDDVPDLFCATAQIFFPEGKRREETGKAVFRAGAGPFDFPVWCETPVEGEDQSYVLYGSGGCSLFDTRKFRQLGGLDEQYKPAYVEDLDLGYRAWMQGWPTVFAAGAQVVHHHQTTTRRYFSEEQIRAATETNHLRFLMRAMRDPALVAERWRREVWRINCEAARMDAPAWPMQALEAAKQAGEWVTGTPAARWDERKIHAIGNGSSAVFPGRQRSRDGRPLVLVASPYLPFPLSHGGAVRMYNLMKRAASEFDQVLITYCDEFQAPAPEVLEICSEVVLVKRAGSHLRPMTERPEVVEEHDTAEFRAALELTMRKWRPSIAQLEFTQMAVFANQCGAAPAMMVEHDVTLDLYSQLAREGGDWETRQQLERWQRWEPAMWKSVSCVVTMSEKDRSMIAGAKRVSVLPNGVDIDRFRPGGKEPEPRRILFIGSFNHLPNLMALDFFVRESWAGLRNAGATLHVIAGRNHEHFLKLYQDRVQPDLSGGGIELEGFVSDVRAAYEKAEVVIAPLLASAGTNIKILEAMAMGKAIVSTPAGINGLTLSPGRDVVVVESGEAMRNAILELFGNREARARIEREARKTVEAEFSWDRIAKKQAALYRDLIACANTKR
jgi:GT2 family glycosyltransferase/glycosyltransferase involved in cell wall biosynthesis